MNSSMDEKLDQILYCNLATVCADGSPWNTPLFFVRKGLTLYWYSPLEAMHSQNILRDGRVFITVFNSQIAVADGDRVALYLRGQASQADETEIDDIIARFNHRVKLSEFFLTRDLVEGKAPTRIWRADISDAWENTGERQGDYFIDVREQLPLS